MERLEYEVQDYFMDLTTFRKLFVHFYDDYLTPKIPIIRDIILQHDITEISVDGHEKLMKLLKLQNERQKLTFDGNLNFALLGGLGFVLNWMIYPNKKETHERISELITKPFVRSLELCKTPRKLALGVGIDHPIRDYGIPNTLVPMIKKELNCSETNEEFVTESGAVLDTNTLFAIVKYVY